MLAATIFNQVVTTLEGNDTLSDYIKNVFKSYRYNVEPDSMPCIMVDIAGQGRPKNQDRGKKDLLQRAQKSNPDHLVPPDDEALLGLEPKVHPGDILTDDFDALGIPYAQAPLVGHPDVRNLHRFKPHDFGRDRIDGQ